MRDPIRPSIIAEALNRSRHDLEIEYGELPPREPITKGYDNK